MSEDDQEGRGVRIPLLEVVLHQSRVNLDLLNMIVKLSEDREISGDDLSQAAEHIARALTEMMALIRTTDFPE